MFTNDWKIFAKMYNIPLPVDNCGNFCFFKDSDQPFDECLQA